MNVCSEVLGLTEFDPLVFDKRIKEIRIPQHNQLLIICRDGSEILHKWQDRSRRESWTGEMRQAARECLKRRQDRGNNR